MTVVNLNKFKKARDLTTKKTEADQNAAKHGRTKAERLAEAARDAQASA
ncbi:DUF4169 family protein, partial [Octadecabacter sp.]|nr:DUF4169 family protein [Octadecabacter sp.]